MNRIRVASCSCLPEITNRCDGWIPTVAGSSGLPVLLLSQRMHEKDIIRIQALLLDQAAEIKRLLDDECAVAAAYSNRISELELGETVAASPKMGPRFETAAAMVDDVVGEPPSIESVETLDSDAMERILSSLRARESSVVDAYADIIAPASVLH